MTNKLSSRKFFICLAAASLAAPVLSCGSSTQPTVLDPLSDRWILFVGLSLNTTPYNGIYGVLGDGTHTRKVDTGPQEFIAPRWSRDGEQIAYCVVGGGIWIGKKDGSDIHSIATGVGCGGRSVYRLSWSPAGDRLIFDSRDHGNYIINVSDGTVSARPDIEGRLMDAPDWSPVGDEFVYASVGDIYKGSIDRSRQTLIVKGGDKPAWSPDGKRIAFTRFFDNGVILGKAIFLVNEDGTRLTQVTAGPNDDEVAWSHDGTQLAYRGTGGGIWVTTVTGSGFHKVTGDSLDVSFPTW